MGHGGVVSRVTKKSRGPGFESHRRGFESWASSLPHSRDASSLSEKDGSRSHTKGGRRHSNVKVFPGC